MFIKSNSFSEFKRFSTSILAAVMLISAIPKLAHAEKIMNGLDLENELANNLNEIENTLLGIKYARFVWNVREGGKWDYKKDLGYNTSYYCLLDDVFVEMTGEEIGNFHYGFVGSSLFDGWTLKAAGGLVQIATNSERKGDLDLSSCDMQSYCDQPDDTAAIQRGINYYNGKSVYEIFGDRICSDISNVTSQFANRTVKIKSIESGGFIFEGANSRAYANGESQAGIFETKLTSDEWIGFKLKGGKWLSVQNDDYLQTNGEKLQSWECFRIYKIRDNYYLFSQKNRKFVQVTNETGRPLKAARAVSSGFTGATWERFEITAQGENPISNSGVENTVNNTLPVNSPSNLTISLNKSTYLLGETVTITPSATDASSYLASVWYGAFATGTRKFLSNTFNGNVTFTPQQEGTYTVRVDANDLRGRDKGYIFAEKTFTVTKASLPIPASIDEGYYTLTPACAPQMRLDVSGAYEGANVWIWSANGSDPQIFKFTSTGNGYYTITSKYSDMVLDAWGASAESGTNVAQHTPAQHFSEADGVNQQWMMVEAGNGYYEIISRMSASACLDVNGAGNTEQTNVQIWARNGTDAQKWKLVQLAELTEKEYAEDELSYFSVSDTKAVVPNVVGMEQLDGIEMLKKAGLSFKVWWYSSDIEGDGTYYILEQSIPENSVVDKETVVQLRLSGSKARSPAITYIRLPKQNVYVQDQFTDVPTNQWFTDSVASAFEMGLMKGYSATTFNPDGDVTISEAITMAARIHSIYTNGGETIPAAGNGERWYQPYLDYAYENGVIRYAYYNCDVSQKANRAQFAEIFARALPDEALAAINIVNDNAIPDVSASDYYASYVYKLYRAGILKGSDVNGTFHPATFITRSEAATIVSRMASSDNRISLTLN